jgi:hypothetical protein
VTSWSPAVAIRIAARRLRELRAPFDRLEARGPEAWATLLLVAREAAALPRDGSGPRTWARRRTGRARRRLIGTAELAALLATLAVQVGQHAHGRAIRVLGDGPPRLSVPSLVGDFWRVRGRLRSPEHASEPAWHPDFAAPRFLLSMGHLGAPFGLPDPKSRTSVSQTAMKLGPSLAQAPPARSGGGHAARRA